MGVGALPWHIVHAYALEHAEEVDRFEYLIQALDRAWLTIHAKRMKESDGGGSPKTRR